jgi:sentrin-specific protease 1
MGLHVGKFFGENWVYNVGDWRPAPPLFPRILPPITAQMHLDNLTALRAPKTQVVANPANAEIRQSDFALLSEGVWINDSVTDAYMNLIVQRSKSEAGRAMGLPKVEALSVFHMPRFKEKGYEGVKSWARNRDLSNIDFLLVPWNLVNRHWAIAVVQYDERQLYWYDSMPDPDLYTQYYYDLKCVKQYLYYHEKDITPRLTAPRHDFMTWRTWPKVICPSQNNGSDCGIFACQVANLISQSAPLYFAQDEMLYWRQRMMVELRTGVLM